MRCYEGQLEDITDEKRHREELEAALRSKIELIGTVSHELRNPLTSIVGYAHLLAEVRDHNSAEHAEMAAVVKQQAEDAANIVEDLLTAAQAEAGTLRVVTAPLDLAEQTRRALAGLAQRHAGTLEVETPPRRPWATPCGCARSCATWWETPSSTAATTSAWHHHAGRAGPAHRLR